MLLLQANTLADAGQPSAEVQEESLSINGPYFQWWSGQYHYYRYLVSDVSHEFFTFISREVLPLVPPRKIDSNFMNVIRDNISSGRIEAAKNLCYQ